MTPAVEIENVTRVFGAGADKVTALREVSFTIAQGEVLALLGTNGAGKTTLTKILATLLLPTSGTVRVFGVDAKREERRVRAMQSVIFGGDRGLYTQLTAVDNLRYFAMLNGVSRVTLRTRLDAALADVGLADATRRPVRTFSKGMRQRLHVAIGMISKPRLLLLDEPTVGLDPVEADRLRQAIGQLRSRGVTVLLTSHHLLDVERLADRVMVLSRGRITHDFPLDAFVQEAGYAATVIVEGRGKSPPASMFTAAGLQVVDHDQGADAWSVRLAVKEWQPAVFMHVAQVLGSSVVTQLRIEEVRLDDVFVEIAGRSQ